MLQEIPKVGVLIGIDYGDVRTGIAFSDYNQKIIVPNGVYGPKSHIVDIVVDLIESRGVVGAIIGWPLNMKGEEAFQCQVVQEFINDLFVKWEGPIHKIDERLSSSYVRSVYSGGVTFKADDALCAMSFLETFITKRNNMK